MHTCRNCSSILDQQLIDLGHQPPSNAYIRHQDLDLPEVTYPLKAYVCTSCWLVQIPDHSDRSNLFTADYAYFSSVSSSWCDHASLLVEKAVQRLSLNTDSFVVELASNDGYLLQFVLQKQIPCLGVEPTQKTAEAAVKKGIDTVQDFFGAKLAEEILSHRPSAKAGADLVIANNVLAHVPDIHDFVEGISLLLKKKGQAVVEFPHLLNLLQQCQYDTIYHEHYSYLSLSVVNDIVRKHGLVVVDVEEISTHGGSLRVWLSHCGSYPVSENVDRLLKKEEENKLFSLDPYLYFEQKAITSKYRLQEFLIRLRQSHVPILGYGAAAKGNTLLNYAGIRSDLIPAIADASISKQGLYMPGSHIPIISPQELLKRSPKTILLFPWNLSKEIKPMFRDVDIYSAIPTVSRL